MHFHSLAVLRIPQVEEDLEATAKVASKLASLERMEQIGPENIMRQVFIRELKGQLNSFSREVYRGIEDLMHPYGSESEDCYEFCDQKGDVQSGYENSSCDCVRLPDGRIVSLYDRSVYGKFVIRNGQVFQKKAGPLQHPMRTHKAKKMKALPDYPFKKLYKTMHEYAIDYCDYMSMTRQPMATVITAIPTLCGIGVRLAADGRLHSWSRIPARNIPSVNAAGVTMMTNILVLMGICGFPQRERRISNGPG